MKTYNEYLIENIKSYAKKMRWPGNASLYTDQKKWASDARKKKYEIQANSLAMRNGIPVGIFEKSKGYLV